MEYREIRSSLKTGDVVLFSGNGLVAMGIRAGTRSKWSHVGMVYVLDGEVFIWESSKVFSAKDMETGRQKKGVQLNLMSTRVEEVTGVVAVRRLANPLNASQLSEVKKFRQYAKGRAYEQNEIELVRSALPGFLDNQKEDLSSLFCSELVAEAYQRASLLKDNPPSNSYVPNDFAVMGKLWGNSLGELCFLK